MQTHIRQVKKDGLEALMSRCRRSDESLAYMKEQSYCSTDHAQHIDLLPFEDAIEGKSIIEGCERSDIEMDRNDPSA